jgi:hypothetical protein
MWFVGYVGAIDVCDGFLSACHSMLHIYIESQVKTYQA